MAKKTNCVVHGKPMYRLRMKIGVDINGKPIYKSFYGEGVTEAKAKQQEYLAIKQKNSSASKNDSLIKLAHFYTYNILLNEQLAPATIEQYERMYRNHIRNSALANTPIYELTRADLQQYVNDLARSGVSRSAVKHTGEFLRKLFLWLNREGYCPDLMHGIIVPKAKVCKDNNISVFTEQEVKKIISTSNGFSFAYTLGLSAGLRLGEILGLKYSDFSNGNVMVQRELNEHHVIDSDGARTRIKEIRETKTKSSIRSVPLPPSVQKSFQIHKKNHHEQMLCKGYRTEYVFTTSSGSFIDSANFRRSWTRHLKNCGIPYRKFHACRATYCTMLCKAGVPLETAARLMGHSDISVTAQFYRMVGSQELRNAANQIDDLFQEPSGDKLATSK